MLITITRYTPKQIEQAARKCHPDKNPGDTAAHAKFQSLSQAYQGAVWFAFIMC
jgi:hypothetical protein